MACRLAGRRRAGGGGDPAAAACAARGPRRARSRGGGWRGCRRPLARRAPGLSGILHRRSLPPLRCIATVCCPRDAAAPRSHQRHASAPRHNTACRDRAQDTECLPRTLHDAHSQPTTPRSRRQAIEDLILGLGVAECSDCADFVVSLLEDAELELEEVRHATPPRSSLREVLK